MHTGLRIPMVPKVLTFCLIIFLLARLVDSTDKLACCILSCASERDLDCIMCGKQTEKKALHSLVSYATCLS